MYIATDLVQAHPMHTGPLQQVQAHSDILKKQL